MIDIQAAVDSGQLTYEKLVSMYIERIAAYDQRGPALNQVIALLEQGEEFAARVEVIFSQAADLAMIGSQASQSLGTWLKNVVYPDVDAYSPEELRERIRTTLRDQILASSEVFKAKPFFLSDELSLVDATIAPILWRLPYFGIDLPAQAQAIARYASHIFARPSFRESLSETEQEMRI